MSCAVIARQVRETARLGFLPRHAGADYLRFERLVYTLMEQVTSDYEGGLWDFHELSNGGFFMAPATQDRFSMSWPMNGYKGIMSAEAAGIAVCLMVLSGLSFESAAAERMTRKFYALRDYASGHAEAGQIFGFID